MGGNVHEIILEKTDAFGAVAASGVKFTCEEKEVAVRARKEVIVAAGAFQSPKLLKLSGIGSADLLGSLGIDTIVDNPGVGENLQDHLMTGFSFEVRDGAKTIDDLAWNDPPAMQAAMGAYMANTSGPFANPGVNSIAFIPFVNVVDADDGAKSKLPLEESHANANGSTMNSFIRSLNKTSDEGSAMLYTYSVQGNFEADGEANPKDITKAIMHGNFITMGVCLLQPMSKGAVHLTSANPKQNPSVDPQYLSKELDVEIFARHLRYLQTLVKTQPLASFLKPDGKRSSPDTDLKDLDAVKEFVRTTAISN